MRILVLGATGMLGHRLLWGLDELGYDVLAGVRNDVFGKEPYCRLPVLSDRSRVTGRLDGFDLKTLNERLDDLRPDVVLNCVGVIKQSDEGRRTVACIALNALLPHVLAETLARWGGRLIHFSTDCVFKGDRGNYTEDDKSDVSDWYGRTKFMGEVQSDNALTLRTSIIGRELRVHRSLVDWFLSQNKGKVRGFTRAIFSGLTTREMVTVIDLLLRNYDELRGLYQVASTPISKYDLLCLIRDQAALEIEIEPDDSTVSIDRSLNGTRFRQATGYVAPEWPELVAGIVDDRKRYEGILGAAP